MVRVKEGWETAQLRTQLGLKKQKNNKSDAVIETHAVDGIALACSDFVKYQITSFNSRNWVGEVNITPCPLTVIRRPPISRRQLHLMVPGKGNKITPIARVLKHIGGGLYIPGGQGCAKTVQKSLRLIGQCRIEHVYPPVGSFICLS